MCTNIFQMTNMKEYTFACPACHEPFSIYLPQKITLATLNECEEKDDNFHNLTTATQCTNCQLSIKVHYCLAGHR